MAEPIAGQGAQRPGSIRSVASNSSIASGTSLTRRARTRARSKTVTGGSSVRSDKLPNSPISELPYLDEPATKESSKEPPMGPPSLTSSSAPPRSPQQVNSIRQLGGPSYFAQEGSCAVTEDGYNTSQAYSGSMRLSSHTSGVQIHPTASHPQPPPSAFSRDPSLTRINLSNIRDSMSTQQSGMSSSIYPPSSASTASGPDSPLYPRSMAEQDDNYDVSSYDPEVEEIQEYDGDDVSYRLRLLVKNSYFLPPAHSKPSPSDLSSSGLNAPRKPVRPTTPTFMDLFRGKSKSKPTTPTGATSPGFDPNLPALRTAADSIAASYALRAQPRSSSQVPRHPPLPGDRSGRVVVVREKMHDLAVAARQAEQEMKARGMRLASASQLGQTSSTNDVVDPTDAVDLPPPSSTSPFAIQASALHGLGVQDSVGAALLADRLPPPGSPMSDPDDSWRKALLHQAVHHSLDSTSPDLSSFSMLDASTPVASPRMPATRSGPRPGSRNANTKRLLEQRILANPRISSDVSPLSKKKSSRSLNSSKSKSNLHLSPVDTSRPSIPLRADTPIGPLTPLTPPPRRYLINPLHSFSQTELHSHKPPKQSSSLPRASPSSLRRTMSSPMLSDAYESDERHVVLTPPPLPNTTLSPMSSYRDTEGAASFEMSREQLMTPSHPTSESHYSDEDLPYDEDMPRASIAMSAMNGGRPSFSEYSQPSPTASAFRDSVHQNSYRSATSSHQQASRRSLERRPVRDSPVPRYSAMSPPPRISSSLAHFALSPPRSSSFHYKAMASQLSSTPPVSDVDHVSSNHSNQPLTDDTTLLIIAPEPATPPFPTSEQCRSPPMTNLSLDAPPTDSAIAIRSTPGPSSPTSFFDSIQTQPNAMDDLDSSSGESEDEAEAQVPLPPPQFLDPRVRAISNVSNPPRPSIMRLGNHSTPYVSHVGEHHRIKDNEARKPVGNTPVRAPFFTERAGKSDQGHGPPVSTYDFFKYTQQHRPASFGEPSAVIGKRRSATIGQVAEWRNHQKAQESLRRLDGMLLQHMETEKDTIKRIATTVRSNIASQNPEQLYS